MRVIAGKYRSRPLQSLRGFDIRPTSDKLRETLFNIICSGNPDALQGTIWLDLYAGTGAVGIEALSRGAALVTFVDSSASSAQLIEKNLRSLSIPSRFRILRTDVPAGLRKIAGSGQAADFVFLDPPYRMHDAYQETLYALGVSNLVQASTLVIAEHDRKFDPGPEFGSLQRYRKLEQGDAALSFYRLEVKVET